MQHTAAPPPLIGRVALMLDGVIYGPGDEIPRAVWLRLLNTATVEGQDVYWRWCFGVTKGTAPFTRDS